MNLFYALGFIYIVLALSTIIVRLPYFSGNSELRMRVNTWWGMVIVFSIAIAISKTISIVFFALVSFMALKEFFTMIPTRQSERGVLFFAYLTIPIQYYFAAKGWHSLFFTFIPIYLFLFLSLRMMMNGDPKDFLRTTGTLHWGIMMMVFCFSHLALLLSLPKIGAMSAGNAGLVLFLVLLTEINDVSQYISGKIWGRHKIIPTVSPNKTWEGFTGGTLVTITIAVVIAQFLTPFTPFQALIAGLLIALSGFVGDAVISAVKRDIKIKDFGSMLPGHGGVLDRIDSLMFSAPIFFYYLYHLYYS